MHTNRRYYWIKQQQNFFKQIHVKKLMKKYNGSTLTIIYQEILLLSIENDSIIVYYGVEKTFEEQLAWELDREIADVATVLEHLYENDLIEKRSEYEYFFPEAYENTGSETLAASRSRKCRALKALEKQKALQCNAQA